MAGNEEPLRPSPLALEWVERLIAFDTTSRVSNLALIEFVAKFLRDENWHVSLTWNHDGRKANLFATLPALNGTLQGGLVLSGHTDVVPVDGQDWTTDPFAPQVRNDRLYGRGACDMKGFLGVAISLAPRWAKLGLPHPVHLALSFDEEVGCLGAPILIEDLARRGVKPDYCIVGEPTNMQPVIAHKGIRILRCSVRGRPSHSSRPHDGVNAIEYASRILNHLTEIARTAKEEGPFDEGFDPPYTSLVVSEISGGTAPNVVAEHCVFTFEYRALPSEDPLRIEREVRRFIHEVINPAMQHGSPELGAKLEVVADVPGFDAGANNSQILKRVTDLTTGNHCKVSYGTEAGQFQATGIQTIVCGPGSIEQAHRADEWVALTDLAYCEEFLVKIAETAVLARRPMAPSRKPSGKA
ncbi:acetylornithine deacetylase [Sphingopyxis chilensis]|uniref:acetylornithine deacetylase n=1 Tax=Sphingopyxis chilensis TaxID=180400 RepID=UPI002DDCD45B|nr:acetylornithine deacetylase [Sphingopyxis chilensis]